MVISRATNSNDARTGRAIDEVIGTKRGILSIENRKRWVHTPLTRWGFTVTTVYPKRCPVFWACEWSILDNGCLSRFAY